MWPTERERQPFYSEAFRAFGRAFRRQRNIYLDTGELLAAPMEEALVRTWERTSEAFRIGAEGTLDKASVPRSVSAYLRLFAGERIEGIEADTRRRLRAVIEQSIREELRPNQTAARVRALFDDMTVDRARRIARTEVTGASNYGALVALQRGRGAAQRTKTWRTRRDERTRETHRAAHGQTVPVGDPFIVGGERLQFPGDPMGSAAEVINCRCHLQEGRRPR